ncbi:hypothetical protein LTR66_008080 [Elasticomyces elasticus]|nr:hypothetical protein LTR66_008080 [Elasticomyces elasticus]
MHLSDFHMFKSMLAASAISALVVNVAHGSGWAEKKGRTPSTLALFPYAGNILGGAMVGAGMALTGACPGTVLVQVALGTRNGLFIGLGGLLGGITYAVLAGHFSDKRETTVAKQSPAEPVQLSSKPIKKHTLEDVLGVRPWTILSVFEAMILLVLSLSIRFEPHGRSQQAGLVSPLMGGFLIGMAQLMSMVVSRHTIGVSTAYEDVARWLGRLAKHDTQISPKSALRQLFSPAVVFVIGILAGAGTLARSPLLAPLTTAAVNTPATDQISHLTAILGGTVMVLGARIAGGCTSGHGISGMATFSISSFVTVAAMFAGGIATAMI